MPVENRIIYRKPARLASEEKYRKDNPQEPQPITTYGTRDSAVQSFTQGMSNL